MRRFVFKPRWVLGHLLVVAAALACLRLGDWQWTRALSTESAQNWGYALQWPLFSVCFVVGWWRMLVLESRRLAESGDAPSAEPAPPLDAPLLAPPRTATDPERSESDSTSHTEAPAADAEDEQLAAYNRMLALLAREDESRRKSSEA